MEDYATIEERIRDEVLMPKLLEKAIKEGYSLTQIAQIKGVSVSWISKLAKDWGIKTPRPGHRPGVPLSEETRQRIAESRRKKEEEVQ